MHTGSPTTYHKVSVGKPTPEDTKPKTTILAQPAVQTQETSNFQQGTENDIYVDTEIISEGIPARHTAQDNRDTNLPPKPTNAVGITKQDLAIEAFRTVGPECVEEEGLFYRDPEENGQSSPVLLRRLRNDPNLYDDVATDPTVDQTVSTLPTKHINSMPIKIAIFNKDGENMVKKESNIAEKSNFFKSKIAPDNPPKEKPNNNDPISEVNKNEEKPKRRPPMPLPKPVNAVRPTKSTPDLSTREGNQILRGADTVQKVKSAIVLSELATVIERRKEMEENY